MRRRHVLAIFIILISSYILAWHLSPTREINMLVVDKTVPENNYREHRSIFWIAEHRRFTNRNGDFLQADSDYLGYHPESGVKNSLSTADLIAVDLLYLADTYGIYDYEEGLDYYEDQLPYAIQDIELLYGGFSFSEAEAIASFAAAPGKLLIGEHNVFGYPTYLDPEASLLLQDLFAVSYNGWLTRYYSDLNEAAYWMKELYSIIYGQEWNIKGAGMVFVREEFAPLGWNRDLVIVQSENFNGPWPAINNRDDQLLTGAASGVPYHYWLEVLTVNPGAKVLAYYDLPLDTENRAALSLRGLPERFPAVIYSQPAGKAARIYFAGDFADQLPALLTPRLTGSAAIQRFFSYLPGLPVEYRFFFQWYEPVLRNILHAGSVSLDE
jgi:hypothetical protein